MCYVTPRKSLVSLNRSQISHPYVKPQQFALKYLYQRHNNLVKYISQPEQKANKKKDRVVGRL